ncbi:hypothetical protein F5878DRAFT_67425 [Lentinula raphanica]|uniref:Uncharacterized protein n=1 Tax=Lentinula raphanica TaxID=153919 RepID=A0AA38U3C0_9AGAR|nr:hypothetical protein F5880DRAFT_275057 [Lentinula raphanica]KAJ3831599.1 hypothetical protein F5878DRAFT_67425 [Lentinula raphanica]
MPFSKRIWGFDLSEMKWSAFKGKNMYDRRWHLRRERLIAYQIAMNICLAAECTATYSLSKYEDLQTHVQNYAFTLVPAYAVELHNDDIIAAEVLTIVFCVFVATLFGADLFFLVLWPRRTYPNWYNHTRLALAVGITAGLLAAALMSTIVIADHSAFITGAPTAMQQRYTDLFFRPPLKYNVYSVNIAYICLLWIGWVCTVHYTHVHGC